MCVLRQFNSEQLYFFFTVFYVFIPLSLHLLFLLLFIPIFSAELNCFQLQWAQGKVLPCCHSIQLPLASRCSIDLWGPSTYVCVCVCPVFIRLIKVSSSLMSPARAVSLRSGHALTNYTIKLHETCSIIYLSCLKVVLKIAPTKPSIHPLPPGVFPPFCASPH